MCLALLVKRMPAAGLALTCTCEAIGKRFAVVSQHRLDLEGRLLFHLLHERASILRGLTASDLQIHPTRGAIDGDVQVAFLLLVGHPRQVLDVDVHIPRFVVLEGLVPRFLVISDVLPSQFRQCRHAAPLEHAMQAGARQPGVQELTRHDEEIIQAEAKEFACCDQHLLLLGRERGQQVVTRVRSIMDIVTVAPAPYGRGGDTILASQLAIRDAGGRCLDLGPDLRCRGRLFMQLDVHELAPG